MGIYINPTDDKDPWEKEEKLLKKAVPITRQEFLNLVPGQDGVFGIAVVTNPLFVAAGVAYSQHEAERFVDGISGRPVWYGLISIDKIREMDPHTADVLTQYLK